MRLPLLLIVTFCLSSSSADAQSRFLNKTADAWATELGHSDAKTRRNAAFALGKLGSSADSAVPRLRRALTDDPDGRVRDAAAFALGEIAKGSLKVGADSTLVELLVERLKNDKEPMVRRSAAYALGRFGADGGSAKTALEAALDESKNPPAVRQTAAWALGQLGAESVPALRQALRDSDPYVQRDAAGSLGGLGDSARDAVPELITCINSSEADVRKAALAVLVKLVGPGDKNAIVPLQKSLSDSDVEARRNAAFALGNIGGAEAAPAVPVLLDALRRGDRELRRLAAVVIKNIGPDAFSAVPDLTRVLTDADEQLRVNAALALGGIGLPAESAVPHLVRRLVDSQETTLVRAESASALSRIGPVAEAVKAVPQLLGVLGDPQVDVRVREKILWALRPHNQNLTNLNAFPTFAKVLAEPKAGNNKMLRYDCAYMLGALQGPSASKLTLDVLLEFLKDDSILIYDTTQVKGGAVGEGSVGAGQRKDLGKGDGRVMALQALEEVGAERVVARADIITQLRAIAADQKAFPKLREDAKKLLEKFGK